LELLKLIGLNQEGAVTGKVQECKKHQNGNEAKTHLRCSRRMMAGTIPEVVPTIKMLGKIMP
jgi:hypothetical protein